MGIRLGNGHVLLIVCRLKVVKRDDSKVSSKSAKNLRARRSLGAAIKRIRAQKGLSQEALASACGLHRTYVGGIERGERNVSIDNIERISIALECSVAELLTEER